MKTPLSIPPPESDLDIQAISQRHIRAFDKWFRMCAGAASDLMSFEGGIIEVKLRISPNMGLSINEIADRISRSWLLAPELKRAVGYRIHVNRVLRPSGFTIPAKRDGELDIHDLAEALYLRLKSLSEDCPEVFVCTVEGAYDSQERDGSAYGSTPV